MKELEMDDFYDAIASPPMNDICYHIASAVYLAKDDDNFSNEQAKWFIKKTN